MSFLLFPNQKLPTYIIRVKRIVLSNRTWLWCRLPYPGHPKGCPNYGKTSRCPPKAPGLGGYFDLSRPLYLVVAEFDLEGHARRMKHEHPWWSDRQCRCVLYWQGTARKLLKTRSEEAMEILGADTGTSCPEAMGLNVFATAALSGIKLEKTSKLKTSRHVALVGWRN